MMFVRIQIQKRFFIVYLVNVFQMWQAVEFDIISFLKELGLNKSLDSPLSHWLMLPCCAVFR